MQAVIHCLNRLAAAAGAFDKARKNDPFPRHATLADAQKGTSPDIKPWIEPFWKDLVPRLTGGLAVQGNILTVDTLDALRYVGGGWLEEAVFCRVREDLPGVEIAMNVKLALVSCL